MLNEHNKTHGTPHQHGKASYLESAKRRAEFSPEALLNMIPLKATDHLLDFGAGTGYLAIPAAKRVDGPVYALDIDPSMLKMIREKADGENLSNVVPILGGDGDLPLPAESIDIVLASLVLHEIYPLAKTIKKIKDVLKTGGYLVVTELEPKNSPSHGAPRISQAGMEQELADAGMRLTEKFFPTENIYVLIAQKY